jgi:hypothetical protein
MADPRGMGTMMQGEVRSAKASVASIYVLREVSYNDDAEYLAGVPSTRAISYVRQRTDCCVCRPRTATMVGKLGD